MLDTEAEALLKMTKGNTISGVSEGGEHKARLDTFNAVVGYLSVRARFVKEKAEESELERLARELRAPPPNGVTHDDDGGGREAFDS